MPNAKAKPAMCSPRAIVRAIERCNRISNPAVVETAYFTVHVRKLRQDRVAQSFVINIIDKAKIE
jgi:hypothetical protein